MLCYIFCSKGAEEPRIVWALLHTCASFAFMTAKELRCRSFAVVELRVSVYSSHSTVVCAFLSLKHSGFPV